MRSEWKEKRLGDVVSITGGGTPSRGVSSFWNGNIPWATVKDFVGLDLVGTKEYITEEGLRNSASNLIPAGRVIIPTRMALGKAAINAIPMAINQDLKALECCDLLETRYLLRWLISNASVIDRMGSGATVKGITLGQLTSLTIPIPPLPEQRRIAAILDKADAIRRKRREAIRLLDDFLRSVFLDMFGDPVTNPKGWKMGAVGDMAADTQYGTSQKAAASGAYPYVRMGNITYAGGWDFSDMKYIDLSDQDENRYLVHKGEVLFNRTNSRELVGKTAVFRLDTPMAFAGYLVKLTVNSRGNSEYLAAAMNTQSIKEYLRSKCKNIVGMANINAREFRAVPLPLPPMMLQNRFATIVQTAEKQKETLIRHASESETLFSSLQSRAFEGAL